ncbi:DUF805 domain-containing protein [Formicincola oecophyllae]|uniref:DUF805 domain-containing protein n=1 Tax=Formicincola oecophyllae TaxID=2558361 RepID=UPI0019D1A1C0|nr:DUF805 domain-containing protein [Formicincola oecophyllae]
MPPTPLKNTPPTGWDWFMQGLRHYSDFKGRSPRAAFWWFAIMSFGFSVLIGWVDVIFKAGHFLSALFWVALFLPMVAVSVRRLHDAGHSSWWAIAFYPIAMVELGWLNAISMPHATSDPFLVLTTFLGVVLLLPYLALAITLFVFYCQLSQPGPNRYGPNPYAPQPGAAPPAPSQPPPTQRTSTQHHDQTQQERETLDLLEKLAALHAQGVLTDAEFERKKAELLQEK